MGERVVPAKDGGSKQLGARGQGIGNREQKTLVEPEDASGRRPLILKTWLDAPLIYRRLGIRPESACKWAGFPLPPSSEIVMKAMS